MKPFLQMGYITLLFFGLCGCATLPPGYEYSTPYENGLSDKSGLSIRVTSNPRDSIFIGNSDTQSDLAFVYSVLGAYENCAQENKLALIHSTKNFSQSSTHTQVGSYTTGGYGDVPAVTKVYSYPVTLTTPAFISLYTCANTFHSLVDKITDYEIVSRELVSPITNDFKGGLLIKKVDGSSEFKESDVILKVNQSRVTNIFEFFDAIDRARVGLAKASVIRNGKIKVVTIKVKDITPETREAQVKATQLVCAAIDAEVKARMKEAANLEHSLNIVKSKNQNALKACDTVSGFLASKK